MYQKTNDKTITGMAVKLAKRGFRVFPVRPNGKAPLRSGWQAAASNDPAEVFELFSEAPEANIGVVADDLVVVDIDPRNGGRADAPELGDLPPTLKVRTAGGGWHYYFDARGTKFRSQTGGLAPGIDIKATGGYVVGPGSKIDGREYAIEADGPVAPVPEHIARRLKTAGETDRKPAAARAEQPAPVSATDTIEALAAAASYLAREAPAGVQGSRNNDAVRVANRIGDFGVAAETALWLMSDYWRCDPPLDQRELTTAVRSAYASRQQPVGVGHPSAGFSVIGAPQAGGVGGILEAEVQLGLTLEELAALPPRRHVAKGVLEHGKVTLFVAPPGAGKSLYSMHLALGVALGDGRKLGLDVREQTRVLVLNTEDEPDELQRRLGAAGLHHGVSDLGKLGISCLDTDKLADTRLVSRTRQSIGRTPLFKALADYIVAGRFGVVILDPLRALHDCQENDNSDMGFVMRSLVALARETDAAILVVHHTRKGYRDAADPDAASGAGSIISSVRLAKTLAVMTETEATEFGVPQDRRKRFVRVDDAKANHQPLDGPPVWFERQSVTLPNGESSPVLAPAVVRSAAEAREARSRQVFEAIKAGRDGGLYPAADRGAYSPAAIISDALLIPRDQVAEAIAHLKATGSVVIDETGRYPRLRADVYMPTF